MPRCPDTLIAGRPGQTSKRRTALTTLSFAAKRSRMLGRHSSKGSATDMVAHMLEALAMWDAIVRFAKDVMLAKEEAESHWQGDERVAPSRWWQARRAALYQPLE